MSKGIFTKPNVDKFTSDYEAVLDQIEANESQGIEQDPEMMKLLEDILRQRRLEINKEIDIDIRPRENDLRT